MANPAVVQGSRDTLTKAILGFKGATAGVKEHEEPNHHLEAVLAAFKTGRKRPEDDSPGRREVGLASHQREIPSERGHEGGGNVLSNEAHGHGLEFARHPQDPGEIAPSNAGEDRKIATGSAAVHTGGNLKSNIPSGPGAVMPGAVSFRTLAAKKAGDRMNEPRTTSGGNRKSVNPAPAAREPQRVGEAPPPVKAGYEKNPGEIERVPTYVAKEPAQTSYGRAAEGVRKLLKAPRR